MATHDYVIDNQSASAFRSDLNGALQAIVTQNSNATAPATTYANMIWYDTAANQLKKRNEANSAWIVLGTIDEGTGTFTPSGERALASQAQAEAGTDNTTVMTPLRSAQAIDTQVNAAKVGLATAGLAAGAVGSYALLNSLSVATRNSGATVAGSNLRYANTYTQSANVGYSTETPSGTWRLMGNTGNYDATLTSTTNVQASVWLRIS